MKFNMGSGQNKIDGFVNVDKYPDVNPDIIWDLEKTPWPIEDSTAEYILFNHSLEHMGQDPNVFLSIMKEIYRVAVPNSTVQINVPHPRHDHFVGDPTHVRPITPVVLSLFSKKNNAHWKKIGAPNTPLALYTNVDFEVVKIEQFLENMYIDKFNSGQISQDEINVIAAERNNIISEYRFTLSVIK